MTALMVQIQVIYALVLREVRTRFGSHRMGYIWALLEPLIWIGTFAALFMGMGKPIPYHLSVVPFLAASFIPYDLFRDMTSRSSTAIGANRGMLFYSQVRPLDLVIARSVLEFCTTGVVFTLIMGGIAIYEWKLEVSSPLLVLVGFLLSAGIGLGLGLVLCGLSAFTNTIERLQGPLMRPLFWISGLFFAPAMVPEYAQKYLLLNPLVHILEIVRTGWFPHYQSAPVSITYPLEWIVILLFIGLTLERIARRRIQLS
jgi:capsular polysaccharide transport system permease protein